MRRVLILNNYPMDRVMKEVELGETPDHVLFGVNRLEEHGYQPVFLPYPARGLWAKVQSWFGSLRLPFELGDLQQQMAALAEARPGDVIFAPCGSQSHFLQYLRATGWLKIPIVTLMHHPFPEGKLDVFRRWQRRLFVKGADCLPSLSQSLADDLKLWGATGTQLAPLPWGTDVDFYGDWQAPGTGVIATGRTGRDFKTFAKAVAKSECPATIIGLEGHLDDSVYGSIPHLRTIQASNEQPVPGEQRGWMKYPALCEHMRRHAAIAIPLFDQKSLAGITSLMDAIGLGRAVLMTRNRHIDIDIEAHGIGFWLEPGDVGGWTERLRWVADHPSEVSVMGAKARQMAEVFLSSKSFSQRVIEILNHATKQHS